jgi:hypothetical protein
MLKEALQYLINLGKVQIIEASNGQEYATSQLFHVKYPLATPLKVETLSGLVDYIMSEFDEETHVGKIVHIVSYRQANLLSRLFSDGQREVYMIAEAFSPKFEFGQWYDNESFIIKLQSCFAQNEDKTKLLKIVGNIKDSLVKKYGDDGITQQVTAKTGIATVAEVPVPNPVMLVPYRTFIEIEQPESKFVFRMRQGNNCPECALFEADGGAWKVDAMDWIKAYLKEKLADTGVTVIS